MYAGYCIGDVINAAHCMSLWQCFCVLKLGYFAFKSLSLNHNTVEYYDGTRKGKLIYNKPLCLLSFPYLTSGMLMYLLKALLSANYRARGMFLRLLSILTWFYNWPTKPIKATLQLRLRSSTVVHFQLSNVHHVVFVVRL